MIRTVNEDDLLALLRSTPSALMKMPDGSSTLFITESWPKKWNHPKLAASLTQLVNIGAGVETKTMAPDRVQQHRKPCKIFPAGPPSHAPVIC